MKIARSLLIALASTAAAWAPASFAQAPTAPAARQAAGDVAPDAVQAMRRMGAYLGTLSQFEVRAATTIDEVMENGMKVNLGGVTTYRVRRPNGFVIEMVTDRKIRHFFYDGKELTILAPRQGLYATVASPPTIAGTLDALYDKYGIALPLQDLFRWADANRGRENTLTDGVHVGYARIDGVDTDHYAFREPDLDWQIWIERGDRPLPRKIVIVSKLEEGQPQYISHLTWNTSPRYTDRTFAFSAPAGALPINLYAAAE